MSGHRKTAPTHVPGHAPWLAREDWARGLIRSADAATMVLAWVFALAFGGGSIPLLGFAQDALPERPGAAAFALLFPAAAVGCLWWAVVSTARWRRFRKLALELATRPGVIGGSLAGTLHTGVSASADVYTLVLSCIRIRRRRKDTDEDVVWEHKLDVQGTDVGRGHAGVSVPFSFEIPYELPSSMLEPVAKGRMREQIVWRVHARAALRGADLSSVFEVPVFETEESDPELTERIGHHTPEPAATGSDPVSGDGVDVRRLPDGALELYFGAARNKVGAAVLTLFAAFWNGFIGYAATFAPGFMKLALLPFAAVGLLLLCFVPVAWLQRTTVRARPGRLEVRTRTLGRGRLVTHARGEIESLAAEPRGKNGGSSLWAVRLHPRQGKVRGIGGDLASKARAQEIAAALWSEISRGR